MPISTGDFFYPYVKFLHGAAYNLHQILEAVSYTHLTLPTIYSV